MAYGEVWASYYTQWMVDFGGISTLCPKRMSRIVGDREGLLKFGGFSRSFNSFADYSRSLIFLVMTVQTSQDPDALPQLIGDFFPVDRWQAHINEIFYGLYGARLRDFYQTFASADYRLGYAGDCRPQLNYAQSRQGS